MAECIVKDRREGEIEGNIMEKALRHLVIIVCYKLSVFKSRQIFQVSSERAPKVTLTKNRVKFHIQTRAFLRSLIHGIKEFFKTSNISTKFTNFQ